MINLTANSHSCGKLNGVRVLIAHLVYLKGSYLKNVEFKKWFEEKNDKKIDFFGGFSSCYIIRKLT